jgi:hypothetical protein
MREAECIRSLWVLSADCTSVASVHVHADIHGYRTRAWCVDTRRQGTRMRSAAYTLRYRGDGAWLKLNLTIIETKPRGSMKLL